MTTAQLGARSGFAVVYVGLAYATVLAVGMARYGLSEPIGDPILAIMEVLTILSALPLLALFVALHAACAPERKQWATLALVFGAMFCCATMGVHVVELTASHPHPERRSARARLAAGNRRLVPHRPARDTRR